MKRVGLLSALLLMVLLTLPAAALAAPRFASPGGGTASGCPQATPCSLATAITGAAANDEVVLTPGTYEVAAKIEATVPLSVRGQAGQPRPRIVGASGVTPLVSFEPLSLSQLAIESSDATEGSVFAPTSGNVFDHLELIARGEAALALRPGIEFTLTDSLLLASGTSSGALFVQGVASGKSQLRNDTVIANGLESVAISTVVVANAATVTIEATNTIADAEIDALAEATKSGSVGTIVFDHSNFDTSKGNVSASASQTTPPVFVNAAAGDYGEAAGSPTINGGVNSEADGVTDLLGNPRALPAFLGCGVPSPAITDIGAYEFVPATPSCVPPQPPVLQTAIGRRKVRGRTAIFRFSGSSAPGGFMLGFQCKLDKRPWRPCGSPKTYRHLKLGRHVFRVRATSAGVVDATPATRRFRIRRPRLHHPRGIG